MPGHNALAELGQVQNGVEFNGKFLLIKNGEPDDGASGDTGYGRGALCINTAGSGALDRLFGQVSADINNPTWKYITCNG